MKRVVDFPLAPRPGEQPRPYDVDKPITLARFRNTEADTLPKRWADATNDGERDLVACFHLLCADGEVRVLAAPQLGMPEWHAMLINRLRDFAHEHDAVAFSGAFEVFGCKAVVERTREAIQAQPDAHEALVLVLVSREPTLVREWKIIPNLITGRKRLHAVEKSTATWYSDNFAPEFDHILPVRNYA